MTDALVAPSLTPLARHRRADTESRGVRIALIAIAVLFLALFLVIPLITVFTEAFANGVAAFFASISEKDALAAIRLTLLVAVISVPANLVFGIAASWAIAKF